MKNENYDETNFDAYEGFDSMTERQLEIAYDDGWSLRDRAALTVRA